MYAITSFGIGKPVMARAIMPDWDLVEGESFKANHWQPGMVLAADGESLEAGQPAPPSKEYLLSTITVTTAAGNTFDGNETARNNMMSAIMAAEIVGQAQSNWKMANNETVLITLDELKEALALSIQRVGEIVLAD